MRAPKLVPGTLVVAALLLVPLAAQAQAQNLADVWTVRPKAGVGMGFEAALRDHMQWRSEAGDPWQWTVYTVETGPDVGAYMIRSSGHSWADFDAYEQGFGPEGGLQVAASFAEMIESLEHEIQAADTARTRLPPNMDEMNLFNVVTWYPRPNQGQALNEVINKFLDAIEEHDHPTYYTFIGTASGAQGPPSITAVFFNENWADFAAEDPTINEIMTETYGEDEMRNIQEQFASSLARVEDYVVRIRRDLSMSND